MDPRVTVFVVEHVHVLPDGEEDVKLIGVYSTQYSAQEAVERLKLMPGFRDTPEEFSINAHALDEDSWAEGYVTYTYSAPDNSETPGD